MVDTPMVMNDVMAKLFRPDLESPTISDMKAAADGKYALPVPWIDPVDVSNALLFLASDDARHVTGVPLSVDLGFGVM
jgi:NAD(P)-dependent dehydrogenase (short-subunit alcohol dehydrogenase family)